MADNQDLIEYFEGLPNTEKQGPASEATLRALLDAFTGKSSKDNKDKKIQQDVNKAKKEKGEN